ncbi:MAG: ABC transporter substrate-binding protein [Rhodospirillaceae bacterium]|jgi:phospholipid transport system substrate-binding protein|nr:ABC transporter substrate-binding protein [Rhodospirillaceae bacterium]
MWKQLTRRMTGLCFGAAIATAAISLPAQAAETNPEIFLRTLADDAVAVLSDDSLDQAGRAHAFRLVLRRGFDIPTVSRFVLGRYWRRASSGEREEFTQLFEDYMVSIYGRRLGKNSGKFLTISGQRMVGVHDAIVRSKIKPENRPTVLLDWRLKQGKNGWRVVDIMAEGVSLAMAQRSEFTAVIRANGGKVAGLLSKLRKKTQTVAFNQGTTSVAVSTQ